jgi:hypothetical protein
MSMASCSHAGAINGGGLAKIASARNDAEDSNEKEDNMQRLLLLPLGSRWMLVLLLHFISSSKISRSRLGTLLNCEFVSKLI